MTNLHVAKKPRNLPPLSLKVKQIVRLFGRAGQSSAVCCRSWCARSDAPYQFMLNAQLLTAVKRNSTTTNCFSAAIIAQS